MTPEEIAAQIIQKAFDDPFLMTRIKETASNRWADGLSDSLFDAVLCFYKRLDETPQRDKDGKIILRAKTDWNAELAKIRKDEHNHVS